MFIVELQAVKGGDGIVKEIGLGLLGFGIVGAGVVEGLRRDADLMEKRAGVRLVLRKVADVDIESDRGVEIDSGLLTQDAYSVINDPEVQIVIELVGGTTFAREFTCEALKLGKPVVTANKALIAKHGKEIFELARKNNTKIYFGASVGSAIPIIRSMREGLSSNRMSSVYGILNGTCNYILAQIEEHKLPFDQVLNDAQEKGYAEADPSLDVDGFDTAHKATILATLAYGFCVPLEDVYVEGLRGIASEDIEYAMELGYRIKLLATIKEAGDDIEVRVHPTLVPLSHILASVNDVFNAMVVDGDLAGEVMCYGRGAGRFPAASTILSDLVDVAGQVASGSWREFPIEWRGNDRAVRKIEDVETANYLRLSVKDPEAGAAAARDLLAGMGISVDSCVTKAAGADGKPCVVITTGSAKDGIVQKCQAEIDCLDVVNAPSIRFRIKG